MRDVFTAVSTHSRLGTIMYLEPRTSTSPSNSKYHSLKYYTLTLTLTALAS
jgi:hypothetical protein